METTVAVSRLENLVKYLAVLNVNDKNIMMSVDDIVSELNEEILKGLKYYENKHYADDDMVNILKRMCYNRISELRYRYYVTCRRKEVTSISLDMEIEFEVSTDEGNPEQLFESSVRVSETSNMLNTEAAKKIFETIIMNKQFATTNNKKVYNQFRVEDIAVATGLSLQDAAVGIREIKEIYAKVVANDNY
jgi:hypothetical protein